MDRKLATGLALFMLGLIMIWLGSATGRYQFVFIGGCMMALGLLLFVLSLDFTEQERLRNEPSKAPARPVERIDPVQYLQPPANDRKEPKMPDDTLQTLLSDARHASAEQQAAQLHYLDKPESDPVKIDDDHPDFCYIDADGIVHTDD